jgi:hypothetical protein
MRASQLDAFSAAATLPGGFRYQPDVLTVEHERQLLQQIATLPFKAFEFRGFEGYDLGAQHSTGRHLALRDYDANLPRT